MAEAPPLLISLGMDEASFSRLDGLRRALFPPERNFIPAHVSLFHHLPAGERASVERVLADEAARPAFPLAFPVLLSLGHALAAQVESRELLATHARLSRAFHPWLTRQDRQRFRPHVTVMNKVPVDVFRSALELHGPAWQPWVGTAASLILWEYLGGPWRELRTFPFQVP